MYRNYRIIKAVLLFVYEPFIIRLDYKNTALLSNTETREYGGEDGGGGDGAGYGG